MTRVEHAAFCSASNGRQSAIYLDLMTPRTGGYAATWNPRRWPVVAGGPAPVTAVCQACGGWAYVYEDDGQQYVVAGFQSYCDALAAAIMAEDSILHRGAACLIAR